MPSNWVTMYDVQLRYRNAAFGHVARTLAARFGSDWFEDQVKTLFKEHEWKELEKNAPERYAASGLNIAVPPPSNGLVLRTSLTSSRSTGGIS